MQIEAERNQDEQDRDAGKQDEQPVIDPETLPTMHIYSMDGGLFFTAEPAFHKLHQKEDKTLREPEEAPAQPNTKARSFFPVFLLILCVFLLLDMADRTLTALLAPTATITITPKGQTIAMTATLPLVTKGNGVQGRILSAVTVTQSKSTNATGHGHQNARQAQGTITFYNGLFVSQTVAAGTTLTGADGVQVLTDQLAMIPAALTTTPPTYGQITVSAHAIQTGSQGNIPVRDINQACCLPSVVAQNMASFQGGQSQREYSYVTNNDIYSAIATLTPPLMQSMHAALQAQVTSNEGLVTLPCTPTTSTDHFIGEEAHEIHVTVSETCIGVAYDEEALQAMTTVLLTQQAGKTVGLNYSLVGAIQVRVVSAVIIDQTLGRVRLTVKASGTWFYHLSPEQVQQLKCLLAGESKTQAMQLLASMPGIQEVTIQGLVNTQWMPTDLSHIRLLVVYGIT